MTTRRVPERQEIEVRVFKWPRRPMGVTVVSLLGEDEFGHWLGVAKGNSWWFADGSRSGVFESSLVVLIPDGTFWTADFNLTDPVVDVDIVLPVHWNDDALDVVDLELDVLRSADGRVQVRDRDEFERVRETWDMPDELVAQAEATCERVRALVETGAEPFGEVGRTWLSRFLIEEGEPST